MKKLSLLFLLLGCSNSAQISSTEPESTAHATRPVGGEVTVALRTDASGQYVTAELGGGGDVNANRPARGPWETFTLVALDGALRDGAQVAFRTNDGAHYLQAALGGGSSTNAHPTAIGPWETFTVVRLAGAGDVQNDDRIALRASDGHYLCAELGGGSVVNANRTAVGPWETFHLETSGGGTGGGGGQGGGTTTGDVRPDDTVMVAPQPMYAVLGTVTGYEMNNGCPYDDPNKCQLPIYLRYDRDDPEWWDILVQELVASHVNVVMAHGRGCYDPTSGDSGNGNMCPRLLRNLVAAIDRAGVRDVIRLGMWDDTGAYQGTRDTVDNLPQSTRFDLGDHSSWRFFWDHNMEIWFDTVPRELWYRLDGHPVVAFWSLSSFFFQNQRNNARMLLDDLRAKFQARYGEDPVFILDSTWLSEDPTLTTQQAYGLNDWFDPSQSNFTYHSWNGSRWGAGVPGFRDGNYYAGCGAVCREYGRRNGQSLRDYLGGGSGAKLSLLEGWTDIAENAGYYRSDAWDYPNQYINGVREYADPNWSSLKLEAEAADAWVDHSGDNLGGRYRGGSLDIGRLSEPQGWFVGWTEGGESITFRDLAFPCGTYRLTARIASPNDGQSVHVRIGGTALGPAAVANTHGWDAYQLLHLGEVQIPAGHQDLEVVFDTGGVNLDWVFLKRVNSTCH